MGVFYSWKTTVPLLRLSQSFSRTQLHQEEVPSWFWITVTTRAVEVLFHQNIASDVGMFSIFVQIMSIALNTDIYDHRLVLY